jgi:hypothetical protein
MQAAAQRSKSAGTDVFVTKLTATGAALVFATYLGGSGYEEPLAERSER